mgnify:CR=1 FL=1
MTLAEPPSEIEYLAVLGAASEALTLLAKGWSRNRPTCPLDEYAPDVVRYHLLHWYELVVATEGAGSSAASPIGGGTRDRLMLAAIKADLENATDRALAPMVHWQSVARIYKRQTRFKHYLRIRQTLPMTHAPRPIEPSPPQPATFFGHTNFFSFPVRSSGKTFTISGMTSPAF